MNPKVFSRISEVEVILKTMLQIKRSVGLLSERNHDLGICQLFDEYVPRPSPSLHRRDIGKAIIDTRNQMQSYLLDACCQLGVYSGIKTYPIKHTSKGAMEAFRKCNRWSVFTRYGRARRKVLKRMIHLVETELRILTEDGETYLDYVGKEKLFTDSSEDA